MLLSTERKNWSTRLADFMVRRRLELLAFTVALATLAVFPAGQVRMDRSLSHMFAANNPLMIPFRHLEHVFAGSEIAMAVYQDPQLFDESGIGFGRLARIRESLCRVPGVAGTVGIDMIMGDRLLHEETQIPIQVRNLFEGVTHGADGQTVSILCVLDPPTKDVTRARTIAGLRRTMAELPDGLPAGTVAGEPFVIEDAFGYMDEDGHHVFTITTVLLALVILANFRSIRWVIIAIAVVQLSLLLTNAVLGLLRWELSLVSPMLTAVVTVVGVATVIQVIVRYREARFSGRPPAEALRLACDTMAVPVTWACVTDAVGFGLLMFAQVGPVRDFGLMMAVGSLIVLFSVLLILPGLALFGGLGSDPKRAWGESALEASLLGIINLIHRRPWLLATSAVLFCVAAMWGLRWLEVETDFTRNFRQNTPIVRSYDVIESRLGGAGVVDVLVPAPQHLSWEFMRKILVMENDLRKNVIVETAAGPEPGLTKAISIADVVVSLSPRHPEQVRWNRMRSAYITSALRTMRNKIPEFYDALFAADPAQADQAVYRVMLRAKERQTVQQKLDIIAQVQSIATKHFPAAGTTGCFSLLTGLIHSILCDQWKAVGLAMIGVFLTMMVALRDLRLTLIAMIPTVIPILVITGLMGWLRFKLNLGGVMIAGVSMALSIDSSIHYLMAYQRSLAEGCSATRALAYAQQSVGRAMVFSTVALILGFAALATSQLVPSYYFGSLVSLTMLGGLIGNLIWLPLLLRLTQGRQPAAVDALAITAAAQRG